MNDSFELIYKKCTIGDISFIEDELLSKKISKSAQIENKHKISESYVGSYYISFFIDRMIEFQTISNILLLKKELLDRKFYHGKTIAHILAEKNNKYVFNFDQEILKVPDKNNRIPLLSYIIKRHQLQDTEIVKILKKTTLEDLHKKDIFGSSIINDLCEKVCNPDYFFSKKTKNKIRSILIKKYDFLSQWLSNPKDLLNELNKISVSTYIINKVIDDIKD